MSSESPSSAVFFQRKALDPPGLTSRGAPLPHDILRILGIEELTEYFVNQVQEVYRLQGVVINDKHIETILRQMLKKIEVKHSGDSNLLPGEIIDRIKFDNMNEKLKSDGKKPAVGASGNIITTGTMTDAKSVFPGEKWTGKFEGIIESELSVEFL